LTLAHALGVVLPAVRCCYAPCDELGHDFFKLQVCGCASHYSFVYRVKLAILPHMFTLENNLSP